MKRIVIKNLSLILLVLITLGACNSNGENNEGNAAKNDHATPNTNQANDLIGKIDRTALETGAYATWFTNEFESYEVNNDFLDQLVTDNVQIKMVLATWCGDSRREVPRFYKVLDKMGYNYENLSVYAVDRKKAADGTEVSELNIERVPTMIFYRDGIEIGRIIESPKTSLEEDMANIVNQ